jgi:YARHG domain
MGFVTQSKASSAWPCPTIQIAASVRPVSVKRCASTSGSAEALSAKRSRKVSAMRQCRTWRLAVLSGFDIVLAGTTVIIPSCDCRGSQAVVTLSSAIEEIVMKNGTQFFAALVGLATLAAAVEPTFAYDDKCNQLWVERNSIYKERGYCFKTERAKDHFGNEGCMHHDEGAVPLSDHERTRIAEIQRLERDFGCQ